VHLVLTFQAGQGHREVKVGLQGGSHFSRVRGGHGLEQTAVDSWQTTGKRLSLIDEKKMISLMNKQQNNKKCDHRS
jgi:hypothetical protein